MQKKLLQVCNSSAQRVAKLASAVTVLAVTFGLGVVASPAQAAGETITITGPDSVCTGDVKNYSAEGSWTPNGMPRALILSVDGTQIGSGSSPNPPLAVGSDYTFPADGGYLVTAELYLGATLVHSETKAVTSADCSTPDYLSSPAITILSGNGEVNSYVTVQATVVTGADYTPMSPISFEWSTEDPDGNITILGTTASPVPSDTQGFLPTSPGTWYVTVKASNGGQTVEAREPYVVITGPQVPSPGAPGEANSSPADTSGGGESEGDAPEGGVPPEELVKIIDGSVSADGTVRVDFEPVPGVDVFEYEATLTETETSRVVAEQQLPPSATSVVFTGVDPALAYTVSISASVAGGPLRIASITLGASTVVAKPTISIVRVDGEVVRGSLEAATGKGAVVTVVAKSRSAINPESIKRAERVAKEIGGTFAGFSRANYWVKPRIVAAH